MGGAFDAKMLQDQEKVDAQAAAANSQQYNKDGSAKANDYHPPSLPQSSWPPNLNAGGHLVVNRDTLTKVSTAMQGELSELQGTLQTLNGGGSGGATLGGWDTASAMGNNSGQAYYGISTFYQNLTNVYDQAITLLRQTVTNYADAEDTTTAAANNVGTDVAPGSLGA